MGQGMCQNVRMVAFGKRLRTMRGSEREVIILDEHHRVFASRLLDHGVSEALVYRRVLLPVLEAEGRPHKGDMAQGPQTLVGKSVVVPSCSSSVSQMRRSV